MSSVLLPFQSRVAQPSQARCAPVSLEQIAHLRRCASTGRSSMTISPSTMTVSTSAPLPYSTNALIGSRHGPYRVVRRLTMTTSALAPAASRPRSFRPRASAPPMVAALKTIGRARAGGVAIDQARNQRGVTHLGDDIERIGIGAKTNPDAGGQVLVE